jgi:DNA-binding protein HU-beta
VNRRDLVNAVANHTGRDRKEVDEVLRGFTDVVTTVVSKGEPVAISGFAKFVKVDRPARMGRNPQTGQPVRIKASKKARITPLKGLKDAVMKPSQAPKLTRGTWPPAPAGAKPAKAIKTTKTAKTAKTAGASKSTAKATATKSPARKAAAATRKTTATRKSAAKRPAARKTAARKR